MANSIPSQNYEYFKGIREFNGVNYNGQISASVCSNVELFKTDIGSTTGIRTVNGDVTYITLPDGYKAIKNFTSNQNGIDYMFIYGENEEKGTLYYINALGSLVTIIDDLTVTGKCNGITMAYGDYDIFVFTNGEEAKTVCLEKTEPVETITAVDNKERTIKWLSMCEWNGFLVVASQYGVHASHQNDIYTWNDTVEDTADSWYIEFGKKTTAVISFSTGLFIFTDKDISHLSGTPNNDSSVLSTVAMNGCYNFEALVVHNTYLFFYDNNQKNIFYIQMTDTGQTRPTGPVAKEIQSYFTGDIDSVKMYSCIYSTYNEIWLLINDNVVIYDYNNQEYVQRNMPSINALCMYKNRVYACDNNGNIRAQKINENFSGVYYPAEYVTSVINMGSNSNMKKQKTPILLTLNTNYTNNFYVEITANYKAKNPKKILLKVSNTGIWASEDDDTEVTDASLWDLAYWSDEDYLKKRVVEISTPQTWYTISLRFFTKEEGEGFSIVSMEMKRLKEKTKTKGR